VGAVCEGVCVFLLRWFVLTVADAPESVPDSTHHNPKQCIRHTGEGECTEAFVAVGGWPGSCEEWWTDPCWASLLTLLPLSSLAHLFLACTTYKTQKT